MKLQEYQTRRYYIFRHVGSGDKLMYRTGEGGWDENFGRAELWSNYTHVERKSKQLFNQLHKFDASIIVVIGSVIVEVDPFYEMKVIAGVTE